MTHVTLREFLKKVSPLDRLLIGILLIGVVTMILSLSRGILGGSQVQVEYLESGNTEDMSVKMLTIDVGGAVQSPGVYQVKQGARFIDGLIAAGGFSAEADRVYCEKTINMAQPLKDGQKIYIPKVADTPGNVGYIETNSSVKPINVNTANATELDTLWGIGEVRAESIVKNRPYESLEELVSKGVISKQILDKNRDEMSVY